MSRYSDVELAGKYVSKASYAKSEGHDFELSFAEFKRLVNRKKCYYTGIDMTKKARGANCKATDVTLDRLDSSLGYVKENTVSCCYAANQFKSRFETTDGVLTPKMAIRILELMESKYE